jgi:hypothetical protein
MAKVEESAIQIPKYVHDTEFIGAGLSAWVHRLDAVVKSYPSNRASKKATEVAIYRRLKALALLAIRSWFLLTIRLWLAILFHWVTCK